MSEAEIEKLNPDLGQVFPGARKTRLTLESHDKHSFFPNRFPVGSSKLSLLLVSKSDLGRDLKNYKLLGTAS